MELTDEKVTLDNIDKSDWKTYRFDQIAKNISERVEPTETDLEIYVGLEHIDSDSIHIKRFGKREDVSGTKLRCYPGDVIFGRRRAYQRKAAIVTFDGFCSAHSLVLRANPSVILPELFPFFLHSDTFMHRAVDISVGSLSPTINWGDLKKQEFLLPPKDQQAQIAELLWAGNEMIERANELTSKTYSAMLSINKETFTQPEFEMKGIMEVASVKRGRFSPRPRNDPRYFGGSIPFIQTSEVIEAKKYINRYERTLNEEGLAVSKMFPKDTIVMAIAGTYVGSCGILNFDSAFTDSLIGIISKPEIISQKYLFYYLRFYEKAIDALATEVAQRNLSLDSFKNFTVRFPKSLDAQNEIVSRLDQLERTIELSEIQSENAKVLQKSLVNKFF